MLNFKKLFVKKFTDEKGFVLAEFVMALPLLILLIYSLGRMTLQIFPAAENQTADYFLEEEAQEILERITQDARTAQKIIFSDNGEGMSELIFVFHTVTNNLDSPNIYNVLDTRRYILYAKKENFTEEGREPVKHLYIHRQSVTTPTNPLTGENSFGNTTIKELKFSIRSEKILHISLKIKSLKSGRTLSVNTSVFMPACEEVEGF